MEVGRYGVAGGSNVLIATHLTIFHAAVSICASVLVVEHLFPDVRSQPWVGRTGLVIAGLTRGLPFRLCTASSMPSQPLVLSSLQP